MFPVSSIREIWCLLLQPQWNSIQRADLQLPFISRMELGHFILLQGLEK
jgi:hypothetical protein